MGLLEEKSQHGYELKQEYDRRFAQTLPLRIGQVIKVGAEPGGGPETRPLILWANVRALWFECPRWDSNPHSGGFKPPASAGWATGARPERS